MKKILLSSLIASTIALSSLAASAAPKEAPEIKPMAGEVEKKGVLVTEECIRKGELKDCRLDTVETSPLALFVHSETKAYRLIPNGVHLRDLDSGIGKNNVTVVGSLEKGNVIKIRAYKAPPPEAKSFFKGCL